jgi:hypothetical protein
MVREERISYTDKESKRGFLRFGSQKDCGRRQGSFRLDGYSPVKRNVVRPFLLNRKL